MYENDYQNKIQAGGSELLRQLHEYVRWADLVHLTAVYSFPTLPTLAACKWLAKPLIWSPRGALQRWVGTRKRAQKRVFEQLCRLAAPKHFTLHVTSEQEAQESSTVFPRANIATVSNGIEILEQFALAQTHRPLRLLFLGRLDPKKGIENLLAALVSFGNFRI